MAQIKDAALCHIFTVHQNLTGNFTGICMGNQTIDTACNSTLPAAARPHHSRHLVLRDREADMLAKNGVQSYGIGSRNIQYYSTALKDIQDMIEKLRARIRELEAELEGRAPRRALGVVPRDW